MSASIGLDQIEEIFSCEVSDEALEAAAGIGNKDSGAIHAFLLHCFRSLPRSLSKSNDKGARVSRVNFLKFNVVE